MYATEAQRVAVLERKRASRKSLKGENENGEKL